MADLVLVNSLEIRQSIVESNHPEDYVLLIDEYEEEDRLEEIFDILRKKGVIDDTITAKDIFNDGYYYGDLLTIVLDGKGQADSLKYEFGIFLVHIWFPDEKKWV